jgi:hypothetical protein
MLFDIFKQFRIATDLELNLSKCVALPLGDIHAHDLLRLLGLRGLVTEFAIITKSKYSGIQVGPIASSVPWQECCFFAAVVAVHFLSFGLLATIRLYNIHCLSKLGYIAPVYAPTSDILKTQGRALTLIQAGPNNV